MKKNTEAVSAQVVLSSITKQQGKNFKKLASIKKVTKSNVDEAVALVKQLKDALRIAEQKKEEIVGPLQNAIEKVRELFRPFYEKVEEAEIRIKTGIKELVVANKEKLKALDAKVASGEIKDISKYTVAAANLTLESDAISVRNVWKAFVVDESKVPRKYLMIDTKKVTEHLRKGGKPIPGIEWKQDESIAI